MLDFTRLQYLEAVYEYKNFTQASKALFVSQPAISSGINALEEELGVKLVVRNSKNVSFTAAGEELIHRIRPILQECRQAEQSMKDLARESEETIHFGFSPAINMPIITKLYSDFLPAHPGMRLYMNEGSMNKHLELLRTEQLDLAYNGIPEKDEEDLFLITPVTQAEIFAVVRPEHPLAGRSSIPFDLLAEEKSS